MSDEWRCAHTEVRQVEAVGRIKKKTTHNPDRKVYAKWDKQKVDRSIELARVGGIPAKWKAIDGEKAKESL